MCAQHFLTSGTEAVTEPNGRLLYTDLDLSGARFENVTLTRITFASETHFDHCGFLGEVRFQNCAFTGYVSFAGATAERLAFRDCRFTHIVNLGGTEFGDLSIRRSEFEAPVELELGPGTVDMHLTTFAGRSRLIGGPRTLELRRVVFRSGTQLRLDGTEIDLNDVEFGASSSLTTFTRFAIDDRPRLLTVEDTDVSPLNISYADLSRCTFGGAHNLDRVHIDSLASFDVTPGGRYTRRRVLWDEVRWRAARSSAAHLWRRAVASETEDVLRGPGLIALDYRALRKAREDGKDEPGAADFYYGEMEMRRLARLQDMRWARTWAGWVTAATEHTLLWLYWLVSGYGLRAWRALVALIVVLLGASVIFRYAGFPGDTHTYVASLRFAVQSAMSLVRGTDEPLTPTGEWIALALRLLGPLLFGLALLALRGRVRR